ncbi:hypothetical protein [Serratia sp. M24T3]|uniref:hypothetical protein n=1 Tax=Serratia sp. M24T3 TaxID=932213 RepID=UPI00025B915D|nr:hypothetical protein [Serratia sp. M24T3]EIC84029.1 hypothetical protein SPM24T3_13970 [Serratia sp. M24T3]
MRGNDRDAIVTPTSDSASTGGGSTEHALQQWIIQTINSLKDDFATSNARSETMHGNITDHTISLGRMASSLERIEELLKNQTAKVEKLDISVKDVDATIKKYKYIILGFTIALSVVGTIITYFFGSTLSTIAHAVMALH